MRLNYDKPALFGLSCNACRGSARTEKPQKSQGFMIVLVVRISDLGPIKDWLKSRVGELADIRTKEVHPQLSW